VAGDQVDLGEDRAPVALGELAALQGQHRVLVGHRRQAELRAAVAEVAAVVDPVVLVEGPARRPVAVVARHVADRPPAGALERPGQGEAVGLDDLVVAPLAVDLDPRLHGGVRQPAEAAEGRRGQEAAARGEARRPQLRVAPVQHGVDRGRDGRALDRSLTVALDEHEQDVLAAQAGQQPVAGRVAEAVACDQAGQDRVIAQAGLHRLHLVDGEGGGARGGDRSADDAQDHPEDAQRRRRSERPIAVARRDVRHAQQRQDRDGEDRDDDHPDDRGDEMRLRLADRVAQRLDADPDVARACCWPRSSATSSSAPRTWTDAPASFSSCSSSEPAAYRFKASCSPAW
jgi:hypothetical protein